MIEGCKQRKQEASIYCSEDCIRKHAEQSLEVVRKERGKVFGASAQV